MTGLTLLFIILLPTLALFRESGRLTPLVVSTLNFTPVLLGYLVLDSTNDTKTALLYAGAVACLMLGYVVHDRPRFRPRPAIGLVQSTRRSDPALLTFVTVVVLLTTYHFTIAGIPLLSEDIETARFDFTSSGLFGIPGRMFLFGLPFIVLLVTLAFKQRLLNVSKKLIHFVWAAYVAANLLGGFKGGLISVVITMLLAQSVIGQPMSLKRFLVGGRALIIVAALLYGGAVALRYRSLGITSPTEVLPYLAARATVSAAEPGYFVLTRYDIAGSDGDYFSQDLTYFVKKYLPFLQIDEEVTLPFEKRVSAALSHTPISSKSFIVPVTPGAFPELVANGGLAGAFIGMFLAGLLLSFLIARAQDTGNAIKAAMFALAVYFIQIYVINGSLIYSSFNVLLVSFLLMLLYGLSYAVARVCSRGLVVDPVMWKGAGGAATRIG